MLTTWKFWKAALIRALHTLAQTALATIGTTALIEQVDWRVVFSASALAAICSILKSIIAGLPECQPQEEQKEESEDKGRITVLAYEDYDDEGNPIGLHRGGDAE